MGLASLAIGVLISNCNDALQPTGDLLASLKAIGWPDSLAVAEIATVEASVTDARGANVLGVELEWATSDSSVVTISKVSAPASATADERLRAGLSAVVTTHASGPAFIIARLSRQGLAPDSLRVPVFVQQRNWDTLLTVSKEKVASIELARASDAVLTDATVTWQSSDPSVLKVTRLETGRPFSVQLTPRTSGTAIVTGTVTGSRLGRSVFQLPVSIGALRVSEATPWDTSLTVTDLRTLDVKVLDAFGVPMDVPKEWRSTNALAVEVGPTGALRALSPGGSEVIVTVGNASTGTMGTRADFQRTEHRVVVNVKNLQLAEKTKWPDTLTVTDTLDLRVTLRDAANNERPDTGVKWSSTNTVAFTVDATGRVTGKNQGGGQVVAAVGEPPFQVIEHRKTLTVLALQLIPTTKWPDTLTVADTVTLAVTVPDPANNPRQGMTRRWSSTNTFAFTVDSTGKVTALNQGGGQIVVSIGEPGFQTTEFRKTLTVIARRVVDSIPWPDTLTVTDTVRLAAFVPGAPGSASAKVRWSSTNPSAFSVDTSGMVIAYGQGSGQVIATVGDAPFQTSERRATITVMPLRIDEPPAAPWALTINMSNTFPLSVLIRDARGNVKARAVTWRSTNTSVMSVDQFGTLTGLNRGTGDIIASVGVSPFQTSELRRTITVLQKWRTVDAGFAHTCAIAASDGTGYCWGSNRFGELGTGADQFANALLPRQIATFLKFDELEAGGDSLYAGRKPEAHSCGRSGTSLFCWGSYASSQIGDGSPVCNAGSFDGSCIRPFPAAVVNGGALAGTDGVLVLRSAAGGRESCGMFMRNSGNPFVSCWGLGFGGDTGLGTKPTSDIFRFTNVTQTVGVMAGGAHFCVPQTIFTPVFQSRAVRCFGDNEFGESGDGVSGSAPNTIQYVRDAAGEPIRYPSRPVDANGVVVRATSAGGHHSCVLETGPFPTDTTATLALCWGSNRNGQLGTATTSLCGTPQIVPCSLRALEVALPVPMTQISAGSEHTCARAATTGVVYCWGSNEFGQLGFGPIGAGAKSQVPVVAAGGRPFLSVSAGAGHTCGVAFGGAIYCWGRNDQGQLGDGNRLCPNGQGFGPPCVVGSITAVRVGEPPP